MDGPPLIGPYILLIIFLSNIRIANSSVALKVHVSAPYAITGRIRVLCSLTLVLLHSRFDLNNSGIIRHDCHSLLFSEFLQFRLKSFFHFIYSLIEYSVFFSSFATSMIFIFFSISFLFFFRHTLKAFLLLSFCISQFLLVSF
jgi:hypothetical protein